MRFVFERLMKRGQVSRDDVTGVINAAGKMGVWGGGGR